MYLYKKKRKYLVGVWDRSISYLPNNLIFYLFQLRQLFEVQKINVLSIMTFYQILSTKPICHNKLVQIFKRFPLNFSDRTSSTTTIILLTKLKRNIRNSIRSIEMIWCYSHIERPFRRSRIYFKTCVKQYR